MGSFFRNQTFPKNWHRRSIAAGFNESNDLVIDIFGAHPDPDLVPGANDVEGVYVPDNNTSVNLSLPPTTIMNKDMGC